jgi:diguanylate cyclase (GGDEF)-like protein
MDSRVLADMAALATAEVEYRDVLRATLDLLEEGAFGSLLSIAVEEPEGVKHYHRVTEDADLEWAREAARYVVEIERDLLPRSAAHLPRPREHHRPVPPAWFLSFAVRTRSGRPFALVFGSPQPLRLSDGRGDGVFHLVRQAALVLDHALLLRQIEDMEVTDSLTGVTNQRRLLEILEYELHRHRYSSGRLGLAIVDVEGLAAINRSYGHQYGNHVLRRLAEVLRDVVRPIDIVARCGTDEFVVVMPESAADDGDLLEERVRTRVAGMEFAGGDIGISVGFIQARPEEAYSAEELLRRAQEELRETKRLERNRAVLWAR